MVPIVDVIIVYIYLKLLFCIKCVREKYDESETTVYSSLLRFVSHTIPFVFFNTVRNIMRSKFFI